MKFIICKTSGKRVNGKGIKYLGERKGRQEGIIELNSTDELTEVLKNYGEREMIIYRTADHGYCTKEEAEALPGFTIELRDDWRD